MRFTSIYRVAVVVMTICSLIVSSCEKPSEEYLPEISIKHSSVDSGKGQQFVSVKCGGRWTLDLVSDEGDVDWAELSVTEGSGNKSNVILTYQANESESSRQLKIILDNGSKWVECPMTQLAAGVSPDPDPDPVPDVNPVKTAWLELPAMDNEDLTYVTHNFKMNGNTYRNYTLGWSQDHYVALWVAYPLCSMYTNKTVNRTDAWAYDPVLGKAYSSAPFSGYGGSYARGHQLPSADRLCSYDANAQTFYGSNMTPQLNAHNEGIWQELETKVRTIANKSDTTYVVTGCIVAGSKTTTTDSDGNRMTVPAAYFKALLRYTKASTLGQWNAAAFYLEHRSYSESIGKQHSMSIDELEKITGMDFFVNLPAKVGADQAAKIEAADPTASSVWW